MGEWDGEVHMASPAVMAMGSRKTQGFSRMPHSRLYLCLLMLEHNGKNSCLVSLLMIWMRGLSLTLADDTKLGVSVCWRVGGLWEGPGQAGSIS